MRGSRAEKGGEAAHASASQAWAPVRKHIIHEGDTEFSLPDFFVSDSPLALETEIHRSPPISYIRLAFLLSTSFPCTSTYPLSMPLVP
jgi:hypothetical protein